MKKTVLTSKENEQKSVAELTKIIFDITRLTGNQFKTWVHKMTAKAIYEGKVKTATVILTKIYFEIYYNDDLPPIGRLQLLVNGDKNKLDYLANNKPKQEDALEFIEVKSEFVRLMIEKVGL